MFEKYNECSVCNLESECPICNDCWKHCTCAEINNKEYKKLLEGK